MIVFDVDGTLVGGETVDWQSFDGAFQQEAGFALDAAFYAGLTEVTAQAIVHQALAELPRAERVAKEDAVRREYLRRLTAAYEQDPDAFPATAGAATLLRELQEAGVPIAIATGDWRDTIALKLRAAGLDCAAIPIATSSDHYSRADIIRAAVRRAGGSLAEAVYVGDGLWDLRACERLGIPFVGIGQRREALQAAGALHLLRDLGSAEFHRTVAAARAARRR